MQNKMARKNLARRCVRQQIQGCVAHNLGIKRTLAKHMDEMVGRNLSLRLADDQERLDRITNPAVLSAEGEEGNSLTSVQRLKS